MAILISIGVELSWRFEKISFAISLAGALAEIGLGENAKRLLDIQKDGGNGKAHFKQCIGGSVKSVFSELAGKWGMVHHL